MSEDVWSVEQYQRFRSERSAAFYDLLRMVDRRPRMRVVDLGCGSGELSVVLHEALAADETIAIDRSAAMLEKAPRSFAAAVEFRRADIADFDEAGAFDLVFSNAALHWLPEHPALLERLSRCLRPAGQLAVQVPANHDQPSHLCAQRTAQAEPFCSYLDGFVSPVHVLAAEDYARILYNLGYRKQRVEMRVYGHTLSEPRDVVEWVKGTLLTPYKERLPAEVYADFVACYQETLLAEIPNQRPFFFPFKRILFFASR